VFEYARDVLFDLLILLSLPFIKEVPAILANRPSSEVLQLIKGGSGRKAIIEAYIHAIKIAVSICITALLVVLPEVRDQTQNGLWACIAIAFLRQDQTASSFLWGYQRLEGTVIGSVYAFLINFLLACQSSETGHCTFGQVVPSLALWVGVCGFFREGLRHGHAAVVAGFTPIVLLRGPVVGSVSGAFLRVQANFFGIGVYVILDNLIFPTRTEKALRLGFIGCIEETREVLRQAAGALGTLVCAGSECANLERLTLNCIFSTSGCESKDTAGDEAILQTGTRFTAREGESALTSGGCATATASASSSVAEQPMPKKESRYRFDFRKCDTYLDKCQLSITNMKGLLSKQASHMTMVVHEPDLLRK
jgi:Fusaric acid resistance protein-like